MLENQRGVKNAIKNICRDAFCNMIIMFFLNDAYVTLIDKTRASDPTKRERERERESILK